MAHAFYSFAIWQFLIKGRITIGQIVWEVNMNGVSLDPLTEEKQHYLSEINKYFNKGNSAGYIKVPTGWGKTFLSKHLMNQYYERGEVILFLVSGNNQLLNQTFYTDGKIKIPHSISKCNR